MLPPMADLSGAYAEARGRLVELLEGLDESRLATRVPACPDWTVRDVLAHVTGVAADAAQERFFLGERDAWTEAQVGSRRGRSVAELAAEWAGWASSVESVLAGTVQLPAGAPDWLRTAPLADLAVHLHDVRGALRRPGDRDAPITRLGLRIYARWLGQRLDQTVRPALPRRSGRSAGTGSRSATSRCSRPPRCRRRRCGSSARTAAPDDSKPELLDVLRLAPNSGAFAFEWPFRRRASSTMMLPAWTDGGAVKEAAWSTCAWARRVW